MDTTKRGRRYFSLSLIIIFLIATACSCGPTGVIMGCVMEDFNDDVFETAGDICWEGYTQQCSLDTMTIEEYELCTENYILENDLAGANEPAPIPQNNGTNNIVAPSILNCNLLNLTSPLSGLPNGTATFYWDVLPGASAYRINLYDHAGTFLASFNSQGATTNLTADVSWGAIGGQYDIQVELVAFGAGGASCRETVTIPREAPSGGFSGGGGGNTGGSAAPAPTASPTPCSTNDCLR